MRDSQRRARQICLGLNNSSADICTMNIKSGPEFAAVAIHLLKEPFVAEGALMAHRLLTCTAIQFFPLSPRSRKQNPTTFPLSDYSLDEI